MTTKTITSLLKTLYTHRPRRIFGRFYNVGIDTRFYISTHVEKGGDIWFCIFERGYYISGKEVYLEDFPERAVYFGELALQEIQAIFTCK